MQLNPSSWGFSHLQETAKNTSLPSLFDPLTLTHSIHILFDLICLWKKKTHLTLYQLHIYFLTASFSCKTNTKINFSILLVSLKTSSFLLVIALACCCSFVGFDCFYNVLICKWLWIKASAKWLKCKCTQTKIKMFKYIFLRNICLWW